MAKRRRKYVDPKTGWTTWTRRGLEENTDELAQRIGYKDRLEAYSKEKSWKSWESWKIYANAWLLEEEKLIVCDPD